MHTLVISNDYDFYEKFDLAKSLTNLPYLLSYDIVVLDLEIFGGEPFYDVILSDILQSFKEFIEKKKLLFVFFPEENFEIYIKEDPYSQAMPRWIDSLITDLFDVNLSFRSLKSNLFDCVSEKEKCSTLIEFFFETNVVLEKVYKPIAVVKGSKYPIFGLVNKNYNIIISPFITHKNITAFIDEVLEGNLFHVQDELKIPEWSHSIMIDNEEELSKIINDNQIIISKAKKRIDKTAKKITELNNIKSVIFTNGKQLENAVESIFSNMGIKVETPNVENRADKLVYLDPSKKCVVEVKGRENKSANEKDAMQVVKWQAEEYFVLEYEPKGILIMNAFFSQPLDKRGDYFPNQMLGIAVKKELAYLRSEDLLTVYNLYLSGKTTAEFFMDELMNTVGLFDISKLKHDQ